MKKSLFAGVTILEPGEPLNTDNGAFAGRDRETIDHFLEVGAKTHRHDGSAGLANPAAPLSASVLASGGSIGADLAITLGYTREDAVGGETMLSPLTVVSTPPALEGPQFMPSAVADYTAGELNVNTYFYALTWSDGEGGETPLGPAVTIERRPGDAHAQIKLSALSFGMVAAGAKGWRLYRAIGGGAYNLLATGIPAEDTFTDDGTHSLQCDTHPPAGEINTTRGVSTLKVDLPSGAAGSWINVYASLSGDFTGSSLLGRYPVASGGTTVSFPALEFLAISPPPVNRSIGGAHKIDPDTELIDWHWKRPVPTKADLPDESEGAEEGDVRIVLSSEGGYIFREGEWEPWVGAGGGGEVTVTRAGGTGPGSYTNGDDFTEPLDDARWVVSGEKEAASDLFETSGGHLVKKGGGPIELTDLVMSQGKVTLKLNRQASGFFECCIYLGVPGLNQRLRCGINGTNFEIKTEPSEGTGVKLDGEAFTALESTNYWQRLTLEGKLVKVELFTEDPSVGSPTPVASAEVELDKEDAIQKTFLAGVHPGIFFVGASGGYVDSIHVEATNIGVGWVEEVEEFEFKAGRGLEVNVTQIETGKARVEFKAPGAVGSIDCGEDLTKPRPNFDMVIWKTKGKGEEKPENMEDGDELIALP